MNATYLSLAQLSRDLEKLRWVRYQTNPFLPPGDPVFYRLDDRNVFFLHPSHESIFRTVVEQARLVPHAMTSADWAEINPPEILTDFDRPVWR